MKCMQFCCQNQSFGMTIYFLTVHTFLAMIMKSFPDVLLSWTSVRYTGMETLHLQNRTFGTKEEGGDGW